MRAFARKLFVVVLALLVADQIVQYTLLRDGLFFGRWVVPFDPPLFTSWQKKRVADLAAIVAGKAAQRSDSAFDAELGWCPVPDSSVDHYAFDWSGSRLGPRPLAVTKDPQRKRVVALGCSFTLGVEVAAEDCWPFQVGEALGYEIANLGVAGYGLDQAYLRLVRDGLGLTPDEVWLGLLPEGLPRVSTLFPPAYRHWSSVVAFKPMFRLDGAGSLELVPNPARDLSHSLALLDDQRAFLDALAPDDLWVRRTPAAFAPRGSSWTHWFATSRLALTVREGGGRDPWVCLEDPGELRSLILSLIRAMGERSRGAGAEFRVIVLPSLPDLLETARVGTPYWNGLLEELRAAGIECLDVTPSLRAARAAENESWWMPQGHYSPTANRVVSQAIVQRLSL